MGEAVSDEISDGDDLEAVLEGEFAELRQAGHGAVGVHDFADDAAGTESGEAGEVDGGFGLTGADEDAAFAGAEGEHVPGTREVIGGGIGLHRGEDGVGAVCRGDAGGDADAGIDGDGEVGAEVGGVARGDQGQVEPIADRRIEGEADEAAAVGGHEVDGFGGGEFSGEGEVTFVFAVFVVNDDEHLALAEELDRFRNGSKGHGVLFEFIG